MATDELADVLSEFARTMLTDFPIQGILDHLVKRIVEILPIGAAGVTLIAADQAPRYVAASDDSALHFEKLQTDLAEGPCVAAYLSGEAVSVLDLNADRRFPRFGSRALAAGLSAVFTFPLRHGDLQLGALDLYRDNPGPLSDDSLRIAQTLADVASAYLINAQARDELQDSSDRASDAAMHDALTGLPNRALMLQRLEHAFTRGLRSEETCAVLFIDLDRFKFVNDTYGHHIGDELLIAVGERLLTVLRPSDTLARMSGDEFVILCEELDTPARADVIAIRVDAELTRPFELSSAVVNMTASIGIAFTGGAHRAPEELIRDADLAMYRSKRNRAGGRAVFDLRELHLAKDHAVLEQALPGAAGRGELHLVYQPIIQAADGRLTGVEALLRWTHPLRGPVPPAVVIPIAEQSGEISELGHWVLAQAWTDRQPWRPRSDDAMAMSVNVSAHQFMSAGFVEMVAGVLKDGSVAAELLTLEVTETIFVRDGERALIVMQDLKNLGVKLALDDFGTGYSSLGYLMRYPVDTVKIDQTFIAGLTENPASRTIVTAVIQLAHGLGMTAIAEGVETAEQYQELIELGCDACQGHFFAPPMVATNLSDLLQSPTELNGHFPA